MKRALDLGIAGTMLIVLVPLVLVIAVAIKLESRGPIFHRCQRVGFRGNRVSVLKFRKMYDGAEGPALTGSNDERFTRLGPFLARTKLDEIPQLWNVLRGEMSLVGPRPEDDDFVALHREAYDRILAVKPGITGLSQLAFVRESEILDPDDRIGQYVSQVLPQKVGLDTFYASNRSTAVDLRILRWTLAAVILRREVAVDRQSGALSVRRRPKAVLDPETLLDPVPVETTPPA